MRTAASANDSVFSSRARIITNGCTSCRCCTESTSLSTSASSASSEICAPFDVECIEYSQRRGFGWACHKWISERMFHSWEKLFQRMKLEVRMSIVPKGNFNLRRTNPNCIDAPCSSTCGFNRCHRVNSGKLSKCLQRTRRRKN